jgi:hypothetical protein
MFVSRPMLWTQLKFRNVDQTHTYIQRSQSSPLDVHLRKAAGVSPLDDAFSLVIPHISRVKCLTIDANVLPSALKHFCCRMPLLEELNSENDDPDGPEFILDGAPFNRDLSCLRELNMWGVTTNLPWKNLASLRVVSLAYCPPVQNVTQLLNFFKSAPLLHSFELFGSISGSSDVPPR